MNKLGIVVLVFVVLNAVVADVLIFDLWNKPRTIETKTVVETKYVYPTAEPSPIASQSSGQASPTKTPVVASKKGRMTTIVPIPGSGSTLENRWKDLTGTEFYLNTQDYPSLIEAYLEVNMKLLNGNGTAFVRLFDATAGIEVWGSEVKTSSQDFVVVNSDKLTLRSGNHLYRIQAKSLTADTTVYNSGRIKIVSEK